MLKMKTNDTSVVYLTAEFKAQMKMVTQYSCTLVDAPMGYGKTTGVREYLKNIKIRVLWQKLPDNSLSGFWKAFCRLFREADADCYEALLQMGFPVGSDAREVVLEQLQKVLLSESTVLVLDDYHLADCPEINSFIEYLLWNELPELHLVLTARYTRFTNLEELILKGYLQHIQKAALEFTPEEIEAYYRLCGVPLQKRDVQKLHAYTEGWISAIYLLMLNYKEEGALTASQSISRLIEKTIYLPFIEEIKDFFMHICLFDTFTLEQAAHMWQKENTEELLRKIVDRNAFVNWDEKSGIYQVHRIFSEFLRELFKRLIPEKKVSLYCRAAYWYAEIGDTVPALRYYYIAEDWEALLETLEADKGHSMLNEHREELITYHDECPEAFREKHPVALLVTAMCLFSYNETERFSEVCEEIGSLLQNGVECKEEPLHEIAGELELLLTFTKYNDLKKMQKHIKAASSLLEHPAQFMDTRGGWTFGSPSVLYMFHREPGQLEEELALLKETLPLYDRMARGHGAGVDYVMEAESFYLRGDLDSAEISAHKALYSANQYKQQDILICAVFVQIRVALYKGDYDYAVYSLQKLKADLEKGKWYNLFHTVQLCDAHLQVCLGQKKDIPEWILNGDFYASKLYFPALAFFNMVYGRVLLIREEYHKLLGSIEFFMENASLFPNVLAQIYTRIYAAAANEKLHRREAALEEIREALALALPDGLLMPFVESCDRIEPLLQELQRVGGQRKEISSILELYEPYRRAVKSITKEYFSADKPSLTKREAEIAQLVAQGLSNKEIGQQLYITQNTVKTLLKRMFEKLGINSRSMLKQYIDSQE